MTRLPLTIAVDHPAFAGHFPGQAVVPGVVLLDESLRAIAGDRTSGVPLRIAQAKFLSIVVPGEAVRLEYEPAVGDDTFRVRVFAGAADAERLAMSGTVAFAAAARDA